MSHKFKTTLTASHSLSSGVSELFLFTFKAKSGGEYNLTIMSDSFNNAMLKFAKENEVTEVFSIESYSSINAL